MSFFNLGNHPCPLMPLWTWSLCCLNCWICWADILCWVLKVVWTERCFYPLHIPVMRRQEAKEKWSCDTAWDCVTSQTLPEEQMLTKRTRTHTYVCHTLILKRKLTKCMDVVTVEDNEVVIHGFLSSRSLMMLTNLSSVVWSWMTLRGCSVSLMVGCCTLPRDKVPISQGP